MPLIIVIQRLWNIIRLGCPSNGVYIIYRHTELDFVLVLENNYYS